MAYLEIIECIYEIIAYEKIMGEKASISIRIKLKV